MFSLQAKYISEEIKDTTAINTSGCYDVQITKASIWQSDFSSSESLNLTFATEDGQKAWVNLFYLNKDGQEIGFNQAHITQLCYLLSVDPKPNQEGELPALVTRDIGIFLEVKKKQKNDRTDTYDYAVKGFYDPLTKQTSKEKYEKQQPQIYYNMVKKYEHAQPVVLDRTTIAQPKAQETTDAFFPIDESNIPF